MILDEVLNESQSFDRDDLVDMFTEGFLFALEMQEEGYKAGSTEELSETIAEGADIAISELDVIDPVRADGKGILARTAEKTAKLRQKFTKKYKNDDGKDRSKSMYYLGMANRATRINDKVNDRIYKKLNPGRTQKTKSSYM